MLGQKFRPSKIQGLLKDPGPNVLTLTRKGDAYQAVLNGTPVGGFSAKLAPGPFTNVRLDIRREKADYDSPRVTALKLELGE